VGKKANEHRHEKKAVGTYIAEKEGATKISPKTEGNAVWTKIRREVSKTRKIKQRVLSDVTGLVSYSLVTTLRG